MRLKNNNLERIEELSDNVVDFEHAKTVLLQTAGGEPPSDENWLNTIPTGTIFLSKPKRGQQAYCDQYCVIDKKDVTTYLLQRLPNGQQIYLWFTTLEFSRNNVLIEIISQVEFVYSQEQKDIDDALPEGEDDGSSDRTV